MKAKLVKESLNEFSGMFDKSDPKSFKTNAGDLDYNIYALLWYIDKKGNVGARYSKLDKKAYELVTGKKLHLDDYDEDNMSKELKIEFKEVKNLLNEIKPYFYKEWTDVHFGTRYLLNKQGKQKLKELRRKFK